MFFCFCLFHISISFDVFLNRVCSIRWCSFSDLFFSMIDLYIWLFFSIQFYKCSMLSCYFIFFFLILIFLYSSLLELEKKLLIFNFEISHCFGLFVSLFEFFRFSFLFFEHKIVEFKNIFAFLFFITFLSQKNESKWKKWKSNNSVNSINNWDWLMLISFRFGLVINKIQYNHPH